MRNENYLILTNAVFRERKQRKAREERWLRTQANKSFWNTGISRDVVGKNVHAKIPKGNMGYDQYTVPDTVAVEPTFVYFL